MEQDAQPTSRSVTALLLAIAALSVLPAAIGLGLWDAPLGGGEVGASIDGFGIAGAAMGALAMALAVSAFRAKRRESRSTWVASLAIAISLGAMVAGLMLPVSLLCYFENAGSC